MRHTWILGVIATALGLHLGAAARAGFVVNVNESGGDVIATGSGKINTTALTSIGNGAGEGLLDGYQNVALFGPNVPISANLYSDISGPSAFGTTDSRLMASSGTGDLVGVTSGVGVGLPAYPLLLWLPEDYASGSPLGSTATWSGQTFASLGLTPGTYTWTWGSGDDADFFQMNIGPAAVPEPSTLALAAMGGLGLMGLVRRRKRA
jgi:hypothetical protein